MSKTILINVFSIIASFVFCIFFAVGETTYYDANGNIISESEYLQNEKQRNKNTQKSIPNITNKKSEPLKNSSNTSYRGDQMLKDKVSYTPMNSLIASLVVDALDILPEEWSEELTPGGSIDALVKPSNSPSTQAITAHYKLDLNIFSKQAITTAQWLFPDISESFKIPDTVYYEKLLNENVDESHTFLGKSQYDQRYSLALSKILSLWIHNFHLKDYHLSQMPSEGIYLRDDTNTLYFYAEGGK